jgi:hypothetical protein
MFQLRGLGADLDQCAANPNDAVCRAFYGTGKVGLVTGYSAQTPPSSFPFTTPATQNPTPGTVVTTVAGSRPWYLSWWALGLMAVGGAAAWKYSRPRKPSSATGPATVPAGGTAGLLGIPMNENGLTYYRWIKAAGVKGNGNTTHYAAWKRGEDPSDHAVANRR